MFYAFLLYVTFLFFVNLFVSSFIGVCNLIMFTPIAFSCLPPTPIKLPAHTKHLFLVCCMWGTLSLTRVACMSMGRKSPAGT